jgi:bis(5'-nucleosidyl)-tetraphosphatase
LTDNEAPGQPGAFFSVHDARTVVAGVVVVRAARHGWRVLFAARLQLLGFSQGLVQAGEDPLTTSRREAREETTIDDLEFRWGETFTETLPYSRNKVARYYLAETRTIDVKLPVNPELGFPEHQEFRWLSFRDAAKLVVPRIAAVLDWARSRVV